MTQRHSLFFAEEVSKMSNLFNEILDGMREIAELEGNEKFIEILNEYLETGLLPSDKKLNEHEVRDYD